jgi:CPA1 family monovalent cation:H+ antiporter
VEVFELTWLLLVVAVGLTWVARRINVPYPSLLALGGVVIALIPDAPRFQIDPDLTLALFLAPVLLDAAYDTSLRDLRRNWIPVTCLVLVAVGITTVAVAWVVHSLFPGIPWAAAVALGALVAPPDAAAATAVLRQLQLPHRLLVILEGESLLNDASSLLIYRLAVGAVASGGLHFSQFAPTFALSVVGSVIAGYILARVSMHWLLRVGDVPSSIVLQFASTFGVWILADHLGLSAIITVVVYAVTIARDAPARTPARQRVPSYAVWETVVFILNVLAFVLIGLQVRPILAELTREQRNEYFVIGAAVLATVILVRIAWVMTYNRVAQIKLHFFGAGRWPGSARPNIRGGLVISWCGMRGIVTLAAAYALPANFPSRDLIVLCAFCVVVGTLVLQGLTLRPLILLLNLRNDREVDTEVRTALRRLAQVALDTLDGDMSEVSQQVRREFAILLDGEGDSATIRERSPYDETRARVIVAQRHALVELRTNQTIGDAAFHQVEERLDWAELNANAKE